MRCFLCPDFATSWASVQKFYKIKEPPKIPGARRVNMHQVSYWAAADIRCQGTKFSRMGDLTPGICATLLLVSNILAATAFQTSLTHVQ